MAKNNILYNKIMINIPQTNIPKINSSNPYMQLLNQTPAQQQSVQLPPPPAEFDNVQNSLLKEVNENLIKLLEKKTKHKKNTYLKITKSMFEQDILSQYPDFPVDRIEMVYSDGKDYFIEIGNKKYPLNKKYFLKFINYILK